MISVLNLPELSDGGDVSDWINRGGTAEKLFELAEKDENAHSFIQSSAQFVSGFVPPDYLIDGLLQRRFLYSLTGRTGSGKTAITLLLAASVALGKPIGKYGVELGRVLYLAGENPDDIRMRWIAMAQQLDFDINAIDVHFIAGTFKISELSATIEQEVARLGGVQFVIVDTSAAFFEGEDDNSNVQHGGHARTLRGLVTLLGGPCVIANCHPVKNAGDDNLIPRGGGAFLAEVDGNLAARNDDSMVELHWQGKFRGPDFAPLPFQLRTVTQEQLKDSKGRTIPTIIASGLTEASREELAAAARGHEDQLLGVLCENDEASYADLARRLGWSLKDGQPNKMRVKRTLQRLKDYKLVTNERDRWTPTEKGRKAFKS